MAKFYKTFSRASKFAGGVVEAATLDGNNGFMHRNALRPVSEIAHDTAAWTSTSKRHFVTVELPHGLFGSHWYDDLNGIPEQPIAQTLFSTRQAALSAHQVTVERYRNDPKWQM